MSGVKQKHKHNMKTAKRGVVRFIAVGMSLVMSVSLFGCSKKKSSSEPALTSIVKGVSLDYMIKNVSFAKKAEVEPSRLRTLRADTSVTGTEGNGNKQGGQDFNDNRNAGTTTDLAKLLEQFNGHLPTSAAFTVPVSSRIFDPSFALAMLTLCSGHGETNTARLFASAGLEVLKSCGYDKDPESAEHTSAFMIGHKTVQYKEEQRDCVVVVIRGTEAGEWYSNFDFAPSRDPDTDYAENFLIASQRIDSELEDVLKNYESPLIIVTGHSRGAACANLLGAGLDERYPVSDVFVYTSATPTTFRGKTMPEYPNIFNLVNRCDVVPMLPLYSWGYRRLGTDIMLNDDLATAARVSGSVESLYSLAPDIPSYYYTRHALDRKGLSEDGLTTFEVMLMIAKGLTGASGGSISTAPGALAESDFGPLFAMLNAAQDNGSILIEHMTQKYMLLLSEEAAKLMSSGVSPAGTDADTSGMSQAGTDTDVSDDADGAGTSDEALDTDDSNETEEPYVETRVTIPLEEGEGLG